MYKFIRNNSRTKLKQLSDLTSKENKKKMEDLLNKENNITKLIITNTIFLIIIHVPEIVATIYHIKYNNSFNVLNYYYDTQKIIDLADFLFLINPLFQFILFYKFNRNFRESFMDKFFFNLNRERVIS